MSFRISGHDRLTGRPSPPYESRAASEAEAREEAERLGILIESLEPIETLAAAQRAEDVELPDWDWPPLVWRTSQWALIRLGFEHPHWGRVLFVTVMLSGILVKSKFVPAIFAAMLAALLTAAGVRADEDFVFLAMIVAVVVVPFLLAKPYVFWRLRRVHAPAGFTQERRLQVRNGEIRWFDGGRERTLPAGSIYRVHELPHSILIGLRHAGEVAIPKSAFESDAWAKRFAARLAEAAYVTPHLGYRSQWLGEAPKSSPTAKLIATVLLIVLLCVLLIILFAAFVR